jgi:hypothetical protein
MTSSWFRLTFYGPRNKENREKCLKMHGIKGFAGLHVSRVGWTGFVNALGDYFHLDVRDFSCEAKFIEVLASKVDEV